MPDCKQRILPVGKVLCTAGAVAEMTGRKGRLVRNGKSVVYQPRSNTGDTDSLNVKETSGCAVPCVPSVCASQVPNLSLVWAAQVAGGSLSTKDDTSYSKDLQPDV